MEARNVIHLYLGCPVMAVTSKLGEHRRKLVGVYDEGEVQSAKLWFAGGISDWDIEDFKLLLRPLSSMTEKEIMETKWPLTFSKWGPYTPQQFQHLLSKGFDLFGLIEKGEALDSTSQPEGRHSKHEIV